MQEPGLDHYPSVFPMFVVIIITVNHNFLLIFENFNGWEICIPQFVMISLFNPKIQSQ